MEKKLKISIYLSLKIFKHINKFKNFLHDQKLVSRRRGEIFFEMWKKNNFFLMISHNGKKIAVKKTITLIKCIS